MRNNKLHSSSNTIQTNKTQFHTYLSKSTSLNNTKTHLKFNNLLTKSNLKSKSLSMLNFLKNKELIKKMGLRPEDCLMVGNDVGEDMITEDLGMKVFLMPADLINKVGKDISQYPQGDFEDLLAYVSEMNK